MGFTRIQLSEAEKKQAFPYLQSSKSWLSNSIVVVNNSSDARLYCEQHAAGNDTIDHMYFEENGQRTELYRNEKGWIWTPTYDLSRTEVRFRHTRICEALTAYGSLAPLTVGPRPKDVALRAALIQYAAVFLYCAIVAVLLWQLRS